MVNVQFLEVVDIFSDLNAEQLEQIYSVCRELVYIQGEHIFAENTPSTEFYIIMEGEVDIQVDPDTVSSSKERHAPGTIATLRKGQSFGEIALVDQGLRSASAVCSTMICKLLMINREDFMTLLKKDPIMGYIVMNNLAADLCFKIRQANLSLRESLLYSPRQLS